MRRASYYREQAERARRLAGAQTQLDTKVQLEKVAQEYDALAQDLENSGVEIRQSEISPQRNH
jgi:hypothetical protein